MTATVIAIFVAPVKHGEQIAVEAVQLKQGKGIVGDRFFGYRKNQPGRNLTLIELELIKEFKQTNQLNIPLNATRRNLITQGIRLNKLVGKIFKIGNVLCRGVELCEPCKVMAKQFPVVPLSSDEIIQAFIRKAGIRAEVLSDGIVRLSDVIVNSDDNV